MEILPEKYKEAMQDWFGKRGISNHVDCNFYEDEADKTMKKATYYTTIDQCTQDANAVLCVFVHVLNQIKSYFPLVKNILDRNDNAGCYSSAVVIARKAAIATKKGFNLMQTEFSEPQKGKDQCDRNVAVIKKHIKSYKNYGKDVTTAKDCFKAFVSCWCCSKRET